MPLKFVPRSFQLDPSGPGSIFWQHVGLIRKRLNQSIYLYPEWHSEKGTAGERGPTCWPLTFLGTDPACRNEQHRHKSIRSISWNPAWVTQRRRAQLLGVCTESRQSRRLHREKGADWPRQRPWALLPFQETFFFISNERHRHSVHSHRLKRTWAQVSI